MTTRTEIEEWFDRGVKLGATHMVVVCDSWDYEDYPCYCSSVEEAHKKVAAPGDMQLVMEVYNLRLNKNKQLNEHRSFNY